MPAAVIDEDVEAGYWRARAGRAEALAAELRAGNAGLTERVAELAGQVARLQESVTTLSGLLFGSSSEKGAPLRRTGREGGDHPGGAGKRGKRGQRPGGPGHGRRDYAHLETEERFIEADAGQQCCAECGLPFEFIGTEDSEQTGWRVKITRIVWRRRRYRRRCSHPGPATACAPPAARPVPKGLFTAGFLARLAHEKHVLGRPVHRIVQALAADGLEVAAGTLCGALKQVAPLIAPWAEAIAAHGRTAGHVHADDFFFFFFFLWGGGWGVCSVGLGWGGVVGGLGSGVRAGGHGGLRRRGEALGQRGSYSGAHGARAPGAGSLRAGSARRAGIGAPTADGPGGAGRRSTPSRARAHGGAARYEREETVMPQTRR